MKTLLYILKRLLIDLPVAIFWGLFAMAESMEGLEPYNEPQENEDKFVCTNCNQTYKKLVGVFSDGNLVCICPYCGKTFFAVCQPGKEYLVEVS